MVVVLLLTLISSGISGYSPECFVRHHEYCGLRPHSDCSVDIPEISDSGYKLTQVIALFRHGDRTFWADNNCGWEEPQLRNCKNEELDGDEEHALCAVGELTVRGFKQHVRNGKMLKRAYGNSILPKKFDGQVYVRSTNFQRTITSAQAVLFGMFSKASAWVHNGYLEHIVVEENQGELINSANRYPQNQLWMNRSLEKSNLERYPQVDQGIQKISKIMGESLDPMDIPSKVFDCVNTNYCHGLPTNVSQNTFDLINQVAPLVWNVVLNYPDRFSAAKTNIGPLLSAIRNEMKKAIASPDIVNDYKRFYLILGHDTGPMLTLLNGLGVFKGNWPPYAARIIFELYEKPNESAQNPDFFVRMVYNEEEQKIPGCPSVLCPWENFKSVLEKLTIPGEEFTF
jgi:lysosomal acid phosphatase